MQTNQFYYNVLNVTLLEDKLQPKQHTGVGGNETYYPLYSPSCCKFAGLCNYLPAASYEGMKNIMQNADCWQHHKPQATK